LLAPIRCNAGIRPRLLCNHCTRHHPFPCNHCTATTALHTSSSSRRHGLRRPHRLHRERREQVRPARCIQPFQISGGKAERFEELRILNSTFRRRDWADDGREPGLSLVALTLTIETPP
jgi:hypothetical protein